MSDRNDSVLIPYPEKCIVGRFCQRYKRFMVEVDVDDRKLWVHTNNSGSMMGLLRPGIEVLVSPAPGKQRKLTHTLEAVKLDDFWIGVNTLTPNRILREAWSRGLLREAGGYVELKSEQRSCESRLDALLLGEKGELWVESKNVTLVEDDVAYFPDAVTSRGQKHLRELMSLASQGKRAACFYVVQRPDATCFAPADFIDPQFAGLFHDAVRTGVEMWVYEATVSPRGIGLGRRIPVLVS